MTTPYFTSVLSSKSLDQQYSPSSSRGHPRGSLKRGRKPRGTGISSPPSPRPFVADAASSSAGVSGTGLATSSALPIPASSINFSLIPTSGSQQAVPTLDLARLLSLNPTLVYRPPILSTNRPGYAPDEDGEGEDELLPAMADDDYSAQLSWQSQSKDNLKYVITSQNGTSHIVITEPSHFYQGVDG